MLQIKIQTQIKVIYIYIYIFIYIYTIHEYNTERKLMLNMTTKNHIVCYSASVDHIHNENK